MQTTINNNDQQQPQPTTNNQQPKPYSKSPYIWRFFFAPLGSITRLASPVHPGEVKMIVDQIGSFDRISLDLIYANHHLTFPTSHKRGWLISNEFVRYAVADPSKKEQFVAPPVEVPNQEVGISWNEVHANMLYPLVI